MKLGLEGKKETEVREGQKAIAGNWALLDLKEKWERKVKKAHQVQLDPKAKKEKRYAHHP